MKAIKSLLVAASLTAATLSSAANAQDVVLPQTTPVELDPENPKEEALGKLSYRGGVEIEPGKGKNKIGGLSGLEWVDDRLYAVSDDGRWFAMELDESRDVLRDVVEIETAPLLGTNGKRLSGKTRSDAEALARAANGEWIVSFEQDHRVWSYPDLLQPAVPSAVYTEGFLEPQSANAGIESLALYETGWLACGEWIDSSRPNCARLGETETQAFTLAPPPPLDQRGGVPTGMDCASNGVCYILFRSYSRDLGNGAAILAISADGQSKVLASWTDALTIDNFEGLTVREEGKQTYLYIVSDNNFAKCREPQNPDCQRTLLMKFEVNRHTAEAPGTPEPVYQTDRVVLKTPRGSITIDLETERAPITAANFLRYVDEGRYDGTRFYRTTQSTWTDDQAGFLQGGTQNNPQKLLDPIAHEPTTQTGLTHTDGALSMARFAPGTATGDFSIMIGDQRGLDANPTAEDPELRPGFAVFGYVVDGMDVVRSIHRDPVDPDKGEGFLKGQMLADTIEIISIRRVEDEDKNMAEDEAETLTPSEQAAIAPIVVSDARKENRTAQLGSRIARDPRFTKLNYASATGLPGLAFGGLEPFHLANPIRKLLTASCATDSEAIREEVACMLAQSDRLAGEGDQENASDILRHVSSNDSFSSEERMQGAKRLYSMGEKSSSDALREEALVRMLRTDGVPVGEQPAILRTLVAMAIKRDDTRTAVKHLEDVTTIDQTDAQSLANLAIFKRQLGEAGAEETMARAIALQEQAGRIVPKGWRDFAAIPAS